MGLLQPISSQTLRVFSNVSSLWLGAIVAFIVYYVARCIYLLYFHPLAQFPGPKLAAISQFWYDRVESSGRMSTVMRDAHRKYGDVLRSGPNTLSFANITAYRDIYGHVKHGQKRFLKNEWYDPKFDATHQEPRIVRVRDPVIHGEQRKALSHAFSARALRDQEEVVHHYVDLLMQQFKNLGQSGQKPINASLAWNWLTFDVIGDLAFAEPFDAVAEGSNDWIKLIFDSFSYEGGVRRALANYGRHLGSIYLRLSYPKKTIDAYYKHRALTTAKAKRRIALGDMDRSDFFSHLLKGGKMTEGSLLGNADTLLLAGSETTATSLSGLTYFLLKNPDCLSKLNEEVRGAYSSIDEITGDSTATLPYLQGCIEEGLRLFPPAPFRLPRDSPGAVIDGNYVPEGTIVGIEVYSMHTDSRYWKDPEAFRPERWIGEGFGDDKRAFQPFSSGPRACLGINLAYLELRIAVAKLVWTFDLEMVSQIDDWIAACGNYLLWRKADLLVKFHPRVAV